MIRNLEKTFVAQESARKGLVWEQPLGTVRGILEEPGPRFVDPYAAEERKAIQAEGGKR